MTSQRKEVWGKQGGHIRPYITLPSPPQPCLLPSVTPSFLSPWLSVSHPTKPLHSLTLWAHLLPVGIWHFILPDMLSPRHIRYVSSFPLGSLFNSLSSDVFWLIQGNSDSHPSVWVLQPSSQFIHLPENHSNALLFAGSKALLSCFVFFSVAQTMNSGEGNGNFHSSTPVPKSYDGGAWLITMLSGPGSRLSWLPLLTFMHWEGVATTPVFLRRTQGLGNGAAIHGSQSLTPLKIIWQQQQMQKFGSALALFIGLSPSMRVNS